VGCITVTEARLGRYEFSLPFQESGLAVMVRSSRLEAGRALLLALLDPQLLRVLLGYLLAIALISGLVWWDEHRVHWAGKGWREALRSYALVFQVMATGPGTNMIVSRTRGHGLVLLSWVVRIVGASLIVSTITLEVLRQPPPVASLPRSLDDLRGLRVAARPGSVSEAKLREPPLAGRLRLVPLPSVADAVPMLLNDQVDAVLADEQQLVFVTTPNPRRLCTARNYRSPRRCASTRASAAPSSKACCAEFRRSGLSPSASANSDGRPCLELQLWHGSPP
jgi:ABC-type amino acid transport substrate-binding protein